MTAIKPLKQSCQFTTRLWKQSKISKQQTSLKWEVPKCLQPVFYLLLKSCVNISPRSQRSFVVRLQKKETKKTIGNHVRKLCLNRICLLRCKISLRIALNNHWLMLFNQLWTVLNTQKRRWRQLQRLPLVFLTGQKLSHPITKLWKSLDLSSKNSSWRKKLQIKLKPLWRLRKQL